MKIVTFPVKRFTNFASFKINFRAFKNRILRRVCGPMRDENGDWGSLQNEEPHRLYRLPNIVRIKSRRLRWTDRLARIEGDRSAFKVLTGNLQERFL